jgi:hypothetical protein
MKFPYGYYPHSLVTGVKMENVKVRKEFKEIDCDLVRPAYGSVRDAYGGFSELEGIEDMRLSRG